MSRWIYSLVLGLALLAGGRAAAVMDPELDVPHPEKTDEKPSRKKPGWIFHRPAKDNPADQLAHADWLAQQAWGQRDAARQYLALVHEWHDAPEAPKAQLAYARLMEERGRYSRAFDEYQYLIDFYAGQFPYADVLEHQFQIAHQLMTSKRAHFLLFPGFEDPAQALPLYKKIVANAPNWDKAPEAQFFVGFIEEDSRDYAEAVKAYEVVMTRYPASDKAEEAEFRRAYCLFEAADERPRDEKSCRVGLTALARYLNRHGAGERAGKAREYRDELIRRLTALYYDRAVFYDRKAGRPEAALMAYRDFLRECSASALAPQVQERVLQLEQQLGIAHEK